MAFGFKLPKWHLLLVQIFTSLKHYCKTNALYMSMVRYKSINSFAFRHDLNEKGRLIAMARIPQNPVVLSAEFIYNETKLVELNFTGIKRAARYIQNRLINEKYTPNSWRTHPLHICPPLKYSPTDPRVKITIDWLFLISSLNFSFWSDREGLDDRYSVEWRTSWQSEERTVWTGYWSLVAAINRALEANIPITDPNFYSSPALCPDSLIADVFRAAPGCSEQIPLLRERIAIMREVGSELCKNFGGSFQNVIKEFESLHGASRTALQLVQMVTDIFPSFRDECVFEGRKVYIWKRAQILVAETWAAFHPSDATTEHPFFPFGVQQLTMFADYRVPQILHYLLIINYPEHLIRALKAHTLLPSRCREEMSVRAASILAVEAIRDEINLTEKGRQGTEESQENPDAYISSVLIDFYLWDLAKSVELGRETIEGIETGEMIPAHRTRSIWY